MRTIIAFLTLMALLMPVMCKSDDTARAEIHIPAGFALTYGSHLFWNKAIGLDNKAFAIGWGITSTVIFGAMWEAMGDGHCSNRHLATAMGFNLLGTVLAIVPILFDSSSSDSKKVTATGNGSIRIPVSIF